MQLAHDLKGDLPLCRADLLCTGEVEHPDLSVHVIVVQRPLELLQEQHHGRGGLEVSEVVVNLEYRLRHSHCPCVNGPVVLPPPKQISLPIREELW